MRAHLKEEEITDVLEKKSQFGFRNTFPERLLRLDPVAWWLPGRDGDRGSERRIGVWAYRRIGVSAKERLGQELRRIGWPWLRRYAQTPFLGDAETPTRRYAETPCRGAARGYCLCREPHPEPRPI
jgi:hypothetical protein